MKNNRLPSAASTAIAAAVDPASPQTQTTAPVSISRRSIVKAGLAGALALGAGPLLAQVAARPDAARPNITNIRIGYQKFNTLNILKGTGDLEKALAPVGVTVEWREFLGGGQLVEALYAGAIDVGHASDGISVFQQASGKGLVYLAAESPYPRGIGILVPRDSPIHTVRDLKGKKVGVGKGYNVQYALVKALEAHGLRYTDIEPVYIVTASDTIAAYQAGAVDAIGLWDPFLAGAQVATPSRLLVDGSGLSNNRTFHLAQPEYATAQATVLKTLFAQLAKTNRWAQQHPQDVVALLAPQLKIDPRVLKLATERRSYGVVPVTPEVVAEQQKLADTFYQLKLIPAPIAVKDAVFRLNLVA